MGSATRRGADLHFGWGARPRGGGFYTRGGGGGGILHSGPAAGEADGEADSTLLGLGGPSGQVLFVLPLGRAAGGAEAEVGAVGGPRA